MDSHFMPTATDEPNQAPERLDSHERTNPILTLTRLAIGAAGMGLDGLRRRIQKAEDKKLHTPHLDQAEQHILPAPVIHENRMLTTLDSETIQEKKTAQLRYAVIGLILETQKNLETGLSAVDKLTRLTYRLTEPVFRPLSTNPMLSSFHRRYQTLVDRGQDVVTRWIELGRKEDRNSQVVAQEVIQMTVDEWIDSLTHNPEIRELVEAQGTSLATEVVEEVRERTVSADTFLEGLARSILRRPPRYQLPEPPPEVKQRATGIHIRKRPTKV